MEGEMEERAPEDEKRLALSPPWDCGSPLYDAFELASVHRVLDSHLMALPFARRRPSPARDAVDMDAVGRAAASRRTAAVARACGRSRRRRAVAKAATRTGKAVLHTICRSVTCSRKL
ncbi:hypothetical protein ACP70R_039379 [Stipagrostis hirtigluma subsp. patula]